MELTRIAGLLASMVGVRVAGAIIGLVMQIVLARWLAPQELGAWFLIVSLASFTGLVTGGGYPALGLTALARYHSLNRAAMVQMYLANAGRDIVKWSVCLLVPGLLFVLAAPVEPSTRLAVVAGLAIAPASAWLRLNGSAGNAVRKYLTAIVPDFIVKPAILLVFVAAWIVMTGGLSLSVVAAGFLILSYMTAWYVANLLGSDALNLSTRARVPARLSGHWRNRSWPLIIVAISMIAMADYLTLVATLVLPKEHVAQVGLAIRLAALVGFFTQASQQFVLRDLTAALAARDTAGARAMLMRTNLACTAVIGAALIGVAAFGHWGLSIFGPAYVPAYHVLMLLLVAQGLRAYGGLNVHVLSLNGKQRALGQACVPVLTIIALCAFSLAPWMGIEGIGLAAIAGELVWCVSIAVLAQRRVGWRADILALLSPANSIGKRKPIAGAPAE